MRNLFRSVVLIVATMLWSCANNSDTEKHQSRRNNITDVKEKIQEIVTEEVMIGSISRLQLMDDYLIVQDYKSDDLLIHLFNRNNFEYVASAIPKGQGPGEITVMGHIGVNEKRREIYMSDHGKLKLFSYPLDSILNDPYYMPEVKKEINNTQFPSDYIFVNDVLSFARIIKPTGNTGHNEAAGKWNMQTGEIKEMNYSHPDVGKKRISIAVSMEHGIVVECYTNRNLMTIMDMEGNLKYNIYGSNWNSRDPLRHYGNAFIRGDKIIVSYSGGNWNTEEYYPDKLLVFNLDGGYIKTLDIRYRISDFCYDQQNDRLIFFFEDMIQFGYLDLDDNLIN